MKSLIISEESLLPQTLALAARETAIKGRCDTPQGMLLFDALVDYLLQEIGNDKHLIFKLTRQGRPITTWLSYDSESKGVIDFDYTVVEDALGVKDTSLDLPTREILPDEKYAHPKSEFDPLTYEGNVYFSISLLITQVRGLMPGCCPICAQNELMEQLEELDCDVHELLANIRLHDVQAMDKAVNLIANNTRDK